MDGLQVIPVQPNEAGLGPKWPCVVKIRVLEKLSIFAADCWHELSYVPFSADTCNAKFCCVP